MPVLEELLAPDEAVELEARRHPAAVVRRALLFLVVAVGALAAGMLLTPGSGSDLLDLLLAGLAALFLLRSVVGLVRWRIERIALTERRLIALTGVVRRKVTSVPLRRVQAATLDRSGWGRVFGAGDLVLDLGDHGSLRIERLARPKTAYRTITALLDEDRIDLREVDDAEEADTGPLPRVVI